MPSETLTLQATADLLGVHYMTAYRYVRLGLLPARKERGKWRVGIHDVKTFLERPPADTPRGQAPWAERLQARMLAGDTSGAWGLVEAALASGAEPSQVYSEILGPALVSIGDQWERGEVGIEDEHVASNVAARIIGQLGPRFARRGRPKGTVVIAAPPGERHGLGASMLADVIRGGGYEVIDLGADTPIRSLELTVRHNEPVSAVCISIVYDKALDAAAEMIAALAESAPQVSLLVGGAAVNSSRAATKLGKVYRAESAAHALEIIDSLVARAEVAR
jgi:excisionase family DNA binding protein